MTHSSKLIEPMKEGGQGNLQCVASWSEAQGLVSKVEGRGSIERLNP